MTREDYYNTIPKVDAAELSAIIDDSMIRLSLIYTEKYQNDAKLFITCFIKFASIKTACAFIVQSYKHTGAYKDCLLSGKDFSGYANKQPIETKWKRVLAEVLLIIYSILNQ